MDMRIRSEVLGILLRAVGASTVYGLWRSSRVRSATGPRIPKMKMGVACIPVFGTR
jgi:hypothetical protein